MRLTDQPWVRIEAAPGLRFIVLRDADYAPGTSYAWIGERTSR